MNFNDRETELVGSWVMHEELMAGDETEKRIETLVTNNLNKVGVAGGGWEVLYQDPNDGRYWELTFPLGEIQGGGPRTLRLLAKDKMQEKYGR